MLDTSSSVPSNFSLCNYIVGKVAYFGEKVGFYHHSANIISILVLVDYQVEFLGDRSSLRSIMRIRDV